MCVFACFADLYVCSLLSCKKAKSLYSKACEGELSYIILRLISIEANWSTFYVLIEAPGKVLSQEVDLEV